MAGNYPIYDPGCIVDTSLEVSKLIDPCSNVELQWEGYPDHCDTIPQGYHIYRTTTPPTSSAVSLCIGIDDRKVFEDKSIHQHPIYYYENGNIATPTYTSLTPRGTQSNRNGITFNRNNKSHIEVPYSAAFDFRHFDFTIEMWVGNLQEPWKFHFPCQTLVAAYAGSSTNALWRVFFEPIAATRSVTVGQSGAPYGINGYSSADDTTGNLVIEFNEFGDGSGQMISEVIMPVTSNTNPVYSWSGNALRYGYSHISITRKGTDLRVYVDGTLKKTIPYPFELGGSDLSVNYPQQNITFGRHYGESGRLDRLQFSQSYGEDTPQPFDFTADGDESFLHGQIYDVRIIKGIAIPPPIGGQVDGVCEENAWHQSFEKLASLPHTINRWTDPDPPINKGAYYRVTAVQCGEDVSCICPNYVVLLKEDTRDINAIAVNTQDELADALDSTPPTMLEVFNTWDRSDPYYSEFYPAGLGATGDHSAWYFNATVDSFVNPNNTSKFVHITAPESQWMKKYQHEAVVQSGEWDDDLLGLTAAYTNIDGQYYSINFVRTQGGLNGWKGFSGNWNCVLRGPGVEYVIESMQVGSYSRNATGGSGWSGKTAFIKIERDGNSLKAWTGNHLSSSDVNRADHVIDPSSEIAINFALDPPPPGLASWLPFQGVTGYGFNAWSQGDAFYRDWHLYPNPNERIFDFTDGAPGRVFDWDRTREKWILATGTAWEVVEKVATSIYYAETGKRYNFNCAGTLTVA